jgi:peptide chain release factor 1
MIFEKLDRADDRYREIEQMITLAHVVSNNKEYSRLMKEYKSLTPIIEKYREYKDLAKEVKDADQMMRDGTLEPELRELAEEEFKAGRVRLDGLFEELRILLIPKDPNDSRNVIVEIR